MTSNRSSESRRTSASSPGELHELQHAVTDKRDGDAAADVATREAAAELHARRAAIAQARSPSGVSLLGRTVLLVAVLGLAALIAIWALLSF